MKKALSILSSNVTKVILGLLALGIMAGVIYALMNASPTVFSEETGQNQIVSEKSHLVMTFPAKMDKKSVEENLEIPDELEGDIEWQGRSLVFEPKKNLKLGKTYTFRANRNALFAKGEPINRDVEFQFTVSGEPKLTSHFPLSDALNIPEETRVTMVFDRAIIPLSSVQGEGAIKYQGEWPVAITPEVKGRWRWLGTSTVTFDPEEGFDPSTTYTVSVPRGITTLYGDKTQEDYTWRFTTKRPKITHSSPRDGGDGYGPDQDVALTFNLPVDIQTVSERVEFFKVDAPRGTKGELLPLNETKMSISVAYAEDEINGRKVEQRDQIVITPSSPLEFKSKYRLLVKNGVMGDLGDLGMENDYILSFSTAGDLTIEMAKYEDYGRLQIEFSNPVDNETLKDNLLIEPLPEGWDDVEVQTQSWSENKRLYVYPDFKPSTKYTVTILDGITDKFGQKLLDPHKFSFVTERLDPSVRVNAKGEFGIFEKSNSPVYHFDSVNVSQIDIEFARIPFDKFLKIRERKSRSSGRPALSAYLAYKTFTVDLRDKLNEKESSEFDLEESLGGKLSPGIYGISYQSPEYTRTYNGEKIPIVRYQYFTITNTALTLKYSGNKALVWATDMQTGEPIPGATIKLHNLKGRVVYSGPTDENGIFETDVDLDQFSTGKYNYNPEFWVTSVKESDFAFLGSKWNDGMSPWNFGASEDFYYADEQPYKLDSYIYTERPIYRPGDTVNFKGILRLRDSNGNFSMPSRKHKAVVSVTDARRNEVLDKEYSINEFGSFSGEVPIDSEAPLGNYRITVQLTPDNELETNYASKSFTVLAYRKPEYEVKVEPAEEDYFDDDDVTFNISGNYYFGAPMNAATVHWNALSTDYYFNKYTDGWYSFALGDAWCWWDCEPERKMFQEGDGELDENGMLKVSFPVDLDEYSVSQAVTLEADVTDLNNQVVSKIATVPVHKSKIYVGLQPEKYSVEPNEKAKIRVVTVNPDGTPAPRKSVKIKLYSREWNMIKKKSVDGYYYYDNEVEDTFIRDQKISTDKEGKAVAEVLIDEGGSYRIVAEVKDSDGRIASAGVGVYGFSRSYFNWPHTNHDRIDVVADKPEYAVGDTAKMLFKSPYQGAGVKALITVERENIMRTEIIDVVGNAQPFEIEITEDLIPNAYVSIVILKPRDGETFDENGNDTGAPAFKIGYKRINVETKRKILDVELEADKEKYKPGEEVNVQVQVHDVDGNPVVAELSLGVVDMSVLALLGFEMPDLVRTFYSRRGLGVKTAQMLIHLVDVFKPGSKGGGGGDGDTRVRSNFQDTAFWLPHVTTDENGVADIKFNLPDNLTTWQILAVAHTKKSTFGADAITILETKDVILRPVRPRFAVVDDEIKIGATVHNFLDDSQTFQVSFYGEGFQTTGKEEQKITVKSGESKKVLFPIKVSMTDEVTFHFKAQSDDAVDEVIESIPVYEYGTPQAVATSGMTEDITEETIYIPSAKDASHGTVTTTVSPTLASYLPKSLEYLARFPYGCAEQTVSSFLPNIALASLEGFDAFDVVDDDVLEKNITAGLAKIYGYQRSDGGFGYFKGSRKSYQYLTAYIVHALYLTDRAGYTVDQGVFDRAEGYLNASLRNQDMENKRDLTNRAYILYVMSEIGVKDVSLMNNLFQKREHLSVFSKAQLAMAYRQSGGNARILLDEIMAHIKIDARGAHFEEENVRYYRWSMHTNTRTTATVLQALVRMDPDNAIIPKVVRRLVDIREEGHWDTTQSTVASIFAMIEYLDETKELDADYDLLVSLNGKSMIHEDFNAENILTRKEVITAFEEMKEKEYNPISFSVDGTGRVYYDILMEYFYTADDIPAAEEGIGIQREMIAVTSEEGDISVANNYKIKLTITIPDDRYYVAVNSPLPAGFEPLDLRLKTNEGLGKGDRDTNYWTGGGWRFDHKEMRDDRIFLFADYLPAGVYEYEYYVRATTPGRFRYRPAHAWEMYYPETFGQTEGKWIEVKE